MLNSVLLADSKLLSPIVTLLVFCKFTVMVTDPFEIAVARSNVVFDDEVPLVNTPPFAATIVAVGRSSTLNPVPLAVTFTDKN